MSERAGRRSPPPPPRLTGVYENDNAILQNWIKDLYQSLVPESGLGDPAFQYAPAQIDENALPDPTRTTIAQAQATANLAVGIILAQRATIASLDARLTALEP